MRQWIKVLGRANLRVTDTTALGSMPSFSALCRNGRSRGLRSFAARLMNWRNADVAGVRAWHRGCFFGPIPICRGQIEVKAALWRWCKRQPRLCRLAARADGTRRDWRIRRRINW
jgi:hypothetical protein